MVHEIADIHIQPEKTQAFIQAVEKAIPQFQQAQGCRSFCLQQGIESPDHFRLVVEWDSVEDHMVTFRNSEGFQIWRALVSEFFVSPPKVAHVETVLDGFQTEK